MSRTRLFIHNFLVYGLGSVMSKIIPLIMLPIVTSIMTDTKYYGINDMVNLVISFAGAIAMMGMYDAMFRMFFEKESNDYRKSICSTALFFVIISSSIICLIMIVFKNRILGFIIDDPGYNLLFFIIIFNTFLTGVQNIVSAPTRMQNKRTIFLITNTLSPILSYTVSIPLLIKGLYVYALPVAAVTSSFIMVGVFYIINRKWFSIKEVSMKHLKTLIKIGVPLMPTFIMYWVCSSFDRVMIKSLLGLNELGIYSVASKIAQISQFIYTAFAMGWQYFAFSTMNDKDQKKMTSNIAKYLLIISLIVTMAVTSISKILFYMLAKGNYSNGYVILPYLFVSPLLLMIFQTVGNQFVVVKKTYPVPLMLMISVIINICLNYFLIPLFGIEGASVATMFSYLVAVVISYIATLRSKLIEKEDKILITLGIFLIYIIIWRIFVSNTIIGAIIITLIFYFIFAIIYKKEISVLLEKFKRKKRD